MTQIPLKLLEYPLESKSGTILKNTQFRNDFKKSGTDLGAKSI